MQRDGEPDTAEHRRLAEATGRAEDDLFNANPWYEWGPYLVRARVGHRARGLQRNGDAWSSFPHDHARSRVVPVERGRDGGALRHPPRALPGAVAVERRRPDPQGADVRAHRARRATTARTSRSTGGTSRACPATRWLRWRYHYPQAAFPYQDLIEENGRRGKEDLEYELLDTGVFADDRFWAVEVTYAKASPTEVLASITVENRGPDEATIDVLPTLWFRNTVAVGGATRPRRCSGRTATRSSVEDHRLAGYRLEAAPGPDGELPRGGVLRQRDQHRAPVRRRARSRRTRRTASTTTSSPGRPRSTRRGRGPRRPGGTT